MGQLNNGRLAGEQAGRLEAAVPGAGGVLFMHMAAGRAGVLGHDHGAGDAAQARDRQGEGPGIQAVGDVEGRAEGVGTIAQFVGAADRTDLGSTQAGIDGDEAGRHRLARRIDDAGAGRGGPGADRDDLAVPHDDHAVFDDGGSGQDAAADDGDDFVGACRASRCLRPGLGEGGRGERQGRDRARENVRQAHQRAPSVTLAALSP